MARVAVVTGASSGIGAATARRLAVDGWALVLVARRRERLQELAAEVGGATVVACDLTDPTAPSQIRTALVDGHGGRLDLLVNNAGARFPGTFAETGVEGLVRHLDVNLLGAAAVTHELLGMLRAQHGAVVNVSSVSGFISRAGTAGYSAAKAALRAFSDALALEEPLVHVGVVVPGFVATEGFPQTQLIDNPLASWAVSDVEAVADAIVRAGPGRQPQVHVPRAWAVATAARAVVPWIIPRVTEALGAEVTPETRSVSDRHVDGGAAGE